MDSDNVIANIKQKQQQWMRERKIELEKEGMPSLSASDLVNALTEKITSKMPNSHQKNIEKAIAGEVETNTCSICFELMLPKIHSPILLFPCGHTFCKECVDHSFKTGKKTCPWCREKITSHAINLSLQNIIVAYAREKNIKTCIEPEIKNNTDYDEQLKMYELRCSILKDEKKTSVYEMEKLEKMIQNEEVSVEILRGEEKNIVQRIETAEKELELVKQHLRKAQGAVEKLYKDIENKQKTIELIDDTLLPLEREKQKISMLIEIQKKSKN